LIEGLIKIESTVYDLRNLGVQPNVRGKKKNAAKELQKERNELIAEYKRCQALLKFQIQYQNESEVVVETNQRQREAER